LRELRQRLRDDVMQMACAPDCEMTMQLWSQKETTLRQIEDALEQLEQGTYGRCEQCGRRIPQARLEAVPFTQLCARCAGRCGNPASVRETLSSAEAEEVEARSEPAGKARPAAAIRRRSGPATRPPRRRTETRQAKGRQGR
jgi:RNA polymerase-binding transcription factor DksA